MNEKALTGFCGLYCADCIRYKSRASHLAQELLNEISEKHFIEYAKVKKAHTKAFENFAVFIDLLKAMITRAP